VPIVEQNSGDDAETARLVDQLDALDRDFRKEEIKARDAIRAALTPRQQARFVVFQEHFRHEMQERLRRMGPGEGRHPGEGLPPGQRRIPPPGRP
jgi:Spy/CpxP family protein refolding chaperone